jgi:hypothetical protein
MAVSPADLSLTPYCHRNAATSNFEPLADCAALGELEHQGGLRARCSLGGKT